VYGTHPEKTRGIVVSKDGSTVTPRLDSPHSPLDTLLLPNDMVTTIEPMQEGICPLVPMMERGVVVKVEVTRR